MTERNIIVGPDYEKIIDYPLGDLLLLLLKSHGDTTLFVDAISGEKFPANVLLDKAIRFAKWLRTLKIEVGDSISIISENRLDFSVIPVAALFVGANFAPLNPDYTPRELEHVLSLSKPKVVVCSENSVDKILQIQPHHPHIKKIVLFGKKPVNEKENVVRYDDIIKGYTGNDIDEDFKPALLDPKETVATVLCSSGTTGLPKGVMCTHYNMTSFIDIVREQIKSVLENDDPSDPIVGLIPFFHSFGFMLMFLNLLRGKELIILSRFSPRLLLETIVKYKIRRLAVPPTVLSALLKYPHTDKYDLSSLVDIRSGAAPMSKNMEQELKRRWKVNHVSQSYGMTETTLSVLLSPESQNKPGSVGKIVPGMMVKVINEQGNALGPYQEGELCFRGPMIMKGYINDPQATAATIDRDGWLHTGDVAYYDEDGYFYIIDRLKELIKYKGFQVAPAELEALLLTHPSIQDAAVIGLPDEDAGELPLAYVVKKHGCNLSKREVEKLIEDNVSHQKRLRGGVIFIDEIPRNPTGKILRRKLREQANKLKSKL